MTLWAKRLATCFGIGRVPFASGTVASFVALLLGWVLVYAGLPVLLGVVAIVTLIGWWACHRHAKTLGIKDPSECVIDEVAGQWLTLVPIAIEAQAFQWRPYVMAFFLFRLFDITKPWPIRNVEKLEGGLGIMADDLVAALVRSPCSIGHDGHPADMSAFAQPILDLAAHVLAKARLAGVRIATAESCTGGLVAGALTDIAGSSDVFERGFVTYSNEAKSELLGVPAGLIAKHGAVSLEVARAMAEGALQHARVRLAVSVTGIAGPGGGTAQKPVGLVCFAGARAGRPPELQERRFGDIGRSEVRIQSVETALSLLLGLL